MKSHSHLEKKTEKERDVTLDTLFRQARQQLQHQTNTAFVNEEQILALVSSVAKKMEKSKIQGVWERVKFTADSFRASRLQIAFAFLFVCACLFGIRLAVRPNKVQPDPEKYVQAEKQLSKRQLSQKQHLTTSSEFTVNVPPKRSTRHNTAGKTEAAEQQRIQTVQASSLQPSATFIGLIDAHTPAYNPAATPLQHEIYLQELATIAPPFATEQEQGFWLR